MAELPEDERARGTLQPTLQEDFVEADEELLWADLPRFNRRLWGYLGWYNLERPHRSLGLRTPFAALTDARASGS